jgi:hypothetical protein
MEMSVSRDQIREWKKDGWKFRVKVVKGKRYVSRRRGGEEKGLGLYDDGLWRLIRDTGVGPSDLELRGEVEGVVEGLVKVIREYHMSSSCVYIVDGFCDFWRYRERQGFFNIVDVRRGVGYYREVVTGEGSSYWVFRAERFYCAGCPAFRGSEESHVLL